MVRVRCTRLLSAVCALGAASVSACVEETKPAPATDADIDVTEWEAGADGASTAETGVDATAPVDVAVPGEDAAAPGEDAAAPGEDAAAPGEDAAAPGEDAAAPGEDAAAPGEDAAAPGEDAAAPGEDAAAPGEDAAVPGEDAGEDATVPAQDATADTSVPVEDAGIDARIDVIETGTGPGSCETGNAFRESRIALGFTPDRVLFGDLNGDTLNDIVIVNSATIAVLRSNASGEYDSSWSVLMSTFGQAIGDIDHDGQLELIVTDGSAGWTEIRNNGAEFRQVRPAGLPAINGSVQLGDFTCDGKNDLLLSNLLLPGASIVGMFGLGESYSSPYGSSGWRVTTAGEYTGDHCTDLLGYKWAQPWGSYCLLKSPIQASSSCGVIDIVPPIDAADLDDDGVYEMVGLQWVWSPVEYKGKMFSVWNQDTNTDWQLITVDYDWITARLLRHASRPVDFMIASKAGALNIYAGNGSGNIVSDVPGTVLQIGTGLSILETTDLNRDGNDEIVTVMSSPELRILHPCK